VPEGRLFRAYSLCDNSQAVIAKFKIAQAEKGDFRLELAARGGGKQARIAAL
jgi:hypothetical protein